VNRGVYYAAIAYLIWGVLPIYWKALIDVPALQILSHRIVWSLCFLFIIVTWKKGWKELRRALAVSKTRRLVLIAALLLGINWLTYIWGVNAGFIVETSLGYFINPIVNVVLGVVFLRERLRPIQWFPIGLATMGVLYLTINYGSLPWIGLTLAFTFGFYGFIKKTASLEALPGLTLETGALFLPAIVYILIVSNQGYGAFGNQGLRTDLLLALTGVVTTLPMLLFGMGARRIHLITLGLLQYIAPTCQLLIGVLIYQEPFTQVRLVGFGMIWLALLFYTLEGLLERRKALSITAA